MASSKALKAASDELLRLNNIIKQLKATTSLSQMVITKGDDDEPDDDDSEYKSMGLKIARNYVRAAKLFHRKAMECHDDACKMYNQFHKDDDPDDDEKDDDNDDGVEKDDEPDDDGEKRFAQIIARARAATR